MKRRNMKIYITFLLFVSILCNFIIPKETVLASTDSFYNKSILTKEVANAVSISAGHNFSLVITSDRSVYSFGSNTNGQLGHGDRTQRTIPTKITGVSNAIAVSAGSSHSLVLTSDGSVYSFGSNSYGQLGHGDSTNRTIPTNIAGISNAIAISAGSDYSLILTSDGSVYSFGYNSYGQLGHGDSTNRMSPTKIVGLSSVKAISAGGSHSLVVTSSGNVYAFGDNYDGQLGQGHIREQERPTLISGITNAVSVSAGYTYSFVITSDGSLYSFGYNGDGQLGHGDTSDRLSPVKIPDINNFVGASAGGSSSLAITSDGSVYSFGINNDGQLGHGDKTNRRSPIKIATISDAISISAKGIHSLVLKSDGNAYSFGGNTNGQLGHGDTMSRSTPENLFDLTGPTSVLSQNISSWTNSNITLTATGSDLKSGMKRIKKPDGTWVTGTSTTHVVSSNGTYNFEFEDNIGNVTTKTITVSNIDKTNPLVTFSPNGNTTYAKTYSSAITTSDVGSGVSTRQYAWSISSSITPTNWTIFGEGESISTLASATGDFYLWVKITDVAGNILTTKSNAFKLDNTVPDGVITGSPSTWQNTNAILSITATDGHSGVKRIQKPDGIWAIGSFTTYVVSSNGTYSFRIEDNAGNTTTKSIVISNIDTIKPTVAFNLTTRDWDKDDISVGLTFNDTGGSLYKEYRYVWTESTEKPTTGWSSFSSVTNPILTKNTNGKWYLHVEVKDNAGNSGYTFGGVYKLDNTAPELTIDSREIESGGTFSYLVRNKLNFTGIVNEDNSDSSVHVLYTIKNTSTNENVREAVLVFEQNDDVTNANFAGSYTIDSSIRNGKYELVFHAINDVGLVTTIAIPFEVANPAMATVNVGVFPKPTGKWENTYMDIYVTESGDFETLKNAVKSYEITNTPTYPSIFTHDITDNKKITLNKIGENYVHIQYILDDGTKVSSTSGPYLIDTSDVSEFEVKLMDSNNHEMNGWTNKGVYLFISDPQNIPISGFVKQYRIENYHTDWQTYREGMKFNLEGEHRIFARIVNKAGMTSDQKAITMKIDQMAPKVNKLLMEQTNDGNYHVTSITNDNLSGVQKIVLNNGTDASSNGNIFEIKGLTAKPSYITASDYAGNSSDMVTFGAKPDVTFEAPYRLDAETYKEDVVAMITGGTNISYKLGNKAFDCKEGICEIIISRNTTLTVINTDGIKESKVIYRIDNIDKSEIRLWLNGERDFFDPTKISFNWNYNLTSGTLTCNEGGKVQTYDVSGTGRDLPGKNYLYECFVEGIYKGKTIKSNRVMIYYDSSSGIDDSGGISEKEVNHNIYIEETGAGTGYYINVRRKNYKYETLPIPENEIMEY